MQISVCGLTVPVIEEVQVSGNAPIGYIEGGNYPPVGSQITPYDVTSSGVICGHSYVPADPHESIENETYMTSALTGFVNGGYIRWGGVVQAASRFECTNVEYGDDAVIFGTVSGVPNHPIYTRHTTYTSEVNYFMAVIRAIYSDFPNSPSYSILIASREIQYDRNYHIVSDQSSWAGNGVRINCAAWKRATGEDEDIIAIPETPEDPNEDDPVGPPPKNPNPGHNAGSDPILIPSLPSEGAAKAGFVTMYKLTHSEMNQFAAEMYADTIWEAIKLYFSNPLDFIVGIMLVPFNPLSGLTYHPKFGQHVFEHGYVSVANQYVEIDCGSLAIEEYYGSCFDYEPYTRITMWLPYIGYRDIPVDEVMGKTISVKYHCDCLTGDCVAFITTSSVSQFGPVVPHVLAQYYGNCGVRVPYNSVSYDAAVAASIQLIGAVATAGITKGAPAAPPGPENPLGSAYAQSAVADLASTAVTAGVMGSAVNLVQGMKPTVGRSGAAGASSGYMSIQKPYIIRRIPWQSIPKDYYKFKGYPLNESMKLKDLPEGFALVDDIQLNDIPAFEEERAEIISWLKGGVLL